MLRIDKQRKFVFIIFIKYIVLAVYFFCILLLQNGLGLSEVGRFGGALIIASYAGLFRLGFSTNIISCYYHNDHDAYAKNYASILMSQITACLVLLIFSRYLDFDNQILSDIFIVYQCLYNIVEIRIRLKERFLITHLDKLPYIATIIILLEFEGTLRSPQICMIIFFCFVQIILLDLWGFRKTLTILKLPDRDTLKKAVISAPIGLMSTLAMIIESQIAASYFSSSSFGAYTFVRQISSGINNIFAVRAQLYTAMIGRAFGKLNPKRFSFFSDVIFCVCSGILSLTYLSYSGPEINITFGLVIYSMILTLTAALLSYSMEIIFLSRQKDFYKIVIFSLIVLFLLKLYIPTLSLHLLSVSLLPFSLGLYYIYAEISNR